MLLVRGAAAQAKGASLTWVRLSDSFEDDLLGATAADIGIWTCAKAYANRAMTNGFVPDTALLKFGSDRKGVRCAKHLAELGYFIRDDAKGGYFIVGHLETNPTREEILAKRAQAVDAGRRGGQAKAARPKQDSHAEEQESGVANRLAVRLAPSQPDPKQPASSGPVRSDPVPIPTQSSEARPDPPIGGRGLFGFQTTAFAEGITKGTGRPYVSAGPFEAKTLEDCAKHAGGLAGEPLMAWYRTKAEKFARSADPKFTFTAARFCNWLNAGEQVDKGAAQNAPPPPYYKSLDDTAKWRRDHASPPPPEFHTFVASLASIGKGGGG